MRFAKTTSVPADWLRWGVMSDQVYTEQRSSITSPGGSGVHCSEAVRAMTFTKKGLMVHLPKS